MKNSYILKIGLIGILVLIISASGCINNSSSTKTYSDGVMSFNYPSNFIDITKEYNSDRPENQSMPMIAMLGNANPFNIQFIMVSKNKTEVTPAEFKDVAISKTKNKFQSQILSINTETNLNGIIIERFTYKLYDSETNRTGLYNDMYFKINDYLYAISVYGPDSNQQQLTNTTNVIFQSINKKINGN